MACPKKAPIDRCPPDEQAKMFSAKESEYPPQDLAMFMEIILFITDLKQRWKDKTEWWTLFSKHCSVNGVYLTQWRRTEKWKQTGSG